MNESQNDILDPAHADDLPSIAGITPDAPLSGQQTDAEWKASDDGNVVERGGQKYVRQEALHAERERAKALSATLARIEPLVPEFTEFLNNKRNSGNANIDRVTRPTADTYTDDDDLRGFALVRGYYKSDGVTPDLDRANSELNIMARVADRAAAKHVGPVQRDSVQNHADANYREALSRTFTDGEPIAERKYLEQVFNSVPPEQRADPQVAQMLEVMALGVQELEARKSGRRQNRREPTFREGASGRSSLGGGDALDALDAAAARARGKTPEQWGKMQKAITGSGGMGTGTILEDIS